LYYITYYYMTLSQLIYFNWTFILKYIFYKYLIRSNKLYIKQMILELEVVQSIYVQKIMIFVHVGWLATEDVDIFCHDV
jgi:hypothetical protein